MAEHPTTQQQQTGFQTAIEDLTDGLSRLVRQHFELARVEIRREAKDVGTNVGALLAFAALGLVGYLLLNVAIILVFGAFVGGMVAMAITAIVLALLHLVVAGVAILRILSHLRDADLGLHDTTEELQRNKQWIKEIRSNSRPELTAQS